jgi:CBS domain-containing protein
MTYVRDILNGKSSEVHSISADATVYEALKLMSEKEIGALVVTEGRKGGRHSLRTGLRPEDHPEGQASKDTLVREVMSSHLIQVRPENTVEECMIVMTGKHVRHLPVFEQESLWESSPSGTS